MMLFGLSACMLSPQNGTTRPPSDPIEVGGGVSLTLPALPQFDEALHLSQLITATYGDAPLRIQSELDLGPDQVVAVMSPLGGPPMMTIRWSSAGIGVEKDAALPGALDGRRVLADIVMAYWPVAFVNTHLDDVAVFREDGTRRQLLLGEEVISEITTTQTGDRETVTITNFAQNYDLTIVSKRPKP